MKIRTALFIFGFAMMISFSTVVFAQDAPQLTDDAPLTLSGNSQNQMGGGGMMAQMNSPMMNDQHNESMIATSDGGVVVMAGPRLIKYDKDMNLVKEVEIPKGKPHSRNHENRVPLNNIHESVANGPQ